MPQPIISQFSRAYNSPIEVNRQVATSTERDAINSSTRWEGMLVYVVADGVTYELAGGISNGDWQEFGGLQDAPSDGEYYARRDGEWEIIPSSQGNGIVAFSGSQYVLSGSGSEVVGTYVIPANLLSNDGDTLKVTLSGLFANSANSKGVNVSVESNTGSQSLISGNTLPTNSGGSFMAEVYLVRTGASSYMYRSCVWYYGITGPVSAARPTNSVTASATDWDSDKDMEVVVSGGAASDVTMNGYTIELIKSI